jgi:hypothetical protein
MKLLFMVLFSPLLRLRVEVGLLEDQDVFWLDVSVDNISDMHKFQCRNHLTDDMLGLLLA